MIARKIKGQERVEKLHSQNGRLALAGALGLLQQPIALPGKNAQIIGSLHEDRRMISIIDQLGHSDDQCHGRRGHDMLSLSHQAMPVRNEYQNKDNQQHQRQQPGVSEEVHIQAYQRASPQPWPAAAFSGLNPGIAQKSKRNQ